AVGDIALYDTFSFVEVPEDAAHIVISALNNTTIRGRNPRATLARPSGDWSAEDGRDARDDGFACSGLRQWDQSRERAPLRAPTAARRAPPTGRKGGGASFGERSFGGRVSKPKRDGKPGSRGRR